jgi:hypothetical protein
VGSRYTIEILLTGGAAAALKEVSAGLSDVGNKAEKMKEGLEKGGEGIESLRHMAEFLTFEKIIEQFDKLADKAGEFAKRMFEAGSETVKDLLHTAGEFEDIQSSMQFSFQDNWHHMYDTAFKESQHLAFTFKQTSDLVANLGKIGVNAFGGMGDEIQKFKGKTGESIGAMDVLQDTLAGTGLAMGEAGRLMRGVHEALVGNFREFKMGLGMPPKLIEEMKTKIHAAGGDMQKSFDGVIESLAKFYGGATKLKELNWNYQLQQMTDKFELLKGAIAGPGLRMVTEGLKAFVDAMGALLADKEAMKALSDAFGAIQRSLAWLGKAAGFLVDFAREIIHVVPWVGSLAGYSAILAFALATLIAVTMTLGAAFLGAAGMAGFLTLWLVNATVATFGLETAGWGLLVVFALLVAAFVFAGPILAFLAAAFIAVAGAIALVVAVAGLLAYGAFQILIDAGNETYTVFDKLKILFEAFSELIDSYNGKTSEMTLETADKLKSMGLYEFVTNTMDFFHRMMSAWHGFLDTITSVGDYIKPVFLPMIEEMKKYFFDILDAFGLMNSATDANKSSVSSWADAGIRLGETLLHATRWVITFIREFLKVHDTKEGLDDLKLWVDQFIQDLKDTFYWIDKIASVMRFIFGHDVKGKVNEGVSGVAGGDSSTGDMLDKMIDDSKKEEAANPTKKYSFWDNVTDASKKAGEDADAGDKEFEDSMRAKGAKRLAGVPNAPEGMPYGIDTQYSSSYEGGSSKGPPATTAGSASTASGIEGVIKATVDNGNKVVAALDRHAAAIAGQTLVAKVNEETLFSIKRNMETSTSGMP